MHVARFKVVWERAGGNTQHGQLVAPAKTDDSEDGAIAEAAAPCSVRDHGAKGDNLTEDTTSLAAALATCASTGGITLVTPGVYLIRPVELHSGAHLVLQPGATLSAWGDRYTWPNSTNKPCDFAQEGSACCLKNLACCVPQKESMLWASNSTYVPTTTLTVHMYFYGTAINR